MTVKSQISIKRFELGYNSLSYLLINSLNKILKQLKTNRTISEEDMKKYRVSGIIEEATIESIDESYVVFEHGGGN